MNSSLLAGRRDLALARIAVCGLLVAIGGNARAADHFLTIGGGYSPTGNQVSLEKNVLFFQQLLAERYPGGAAHDIYFSDGDSPHRDVQFVDPQCQVPRANLLLARLAHEEDELGFQYRKHNVPGIRGGSSRENLERWFADVGGKLPPGDRLIVYVTGHGGHSDDPQNTHFYLWNQEKVSVREFVTMLDKVPPQVPVVVVMVQCFSGGFANIIFQEGQSAKGLSPANRCGFFATVHDRTAAGCTADIAEENYKEYSSAFWAAIRHKTRTGQDVPAPDYDSNGAVSFTEAHAYTLLTSDTIDISIRTSDALLRAFSKNKPGEAPNLVTADSPYDQVLALASPADRAVLEGLSQQLTLTGNERAKGARELADKVEQERKCLEDQRNKLNGPADQFREQVRYALKLRWPEFANRWDPKVSDFLRDQPQEIVSAIESHPSFGGFTKAHDEMEALAKQRFDLERKWVKCQRFLRLIDNVTLAANLGAVASPEIQSRYQQLLAAENGRLE